MEDGSYWVKQLKHFVKDNFINLETLVLKC